MPRKHIPVPVPAGHKYCHKCASVHPLSAFYADRRLPDGHKSACRECNATHRRDRRALMAEHEAFFAEADRRRAAIPYAGPEVIPEEHRKTAEDFRRIDAARRRQRLNQLRG